MHEPIASLRGNNVSQGFLLLSVYNKWAHVTDVFGGQFFILGTCCLFFSICLLILFWCVCFFFFFSAVLTMAPRSSRVRRTSLRNVLMNTRLKSRSIDLEAVSQLLLGSNYCASYAWPGRR